MPHSILDAQRRGLGITSLALGDATAIEPFGSFVFAYSAPQDVRTQAQSLSNSLTTLYLQITTNDDTKGAIGAGGIS